MTAEEKHETDKNRHFQHLDLQMNERDNAFNNCHKPTAKHNTTSSYPPESKKVAFKHTMTEHGHYPSHTRRSMKNTR